MDLVECLGHNQALIGNDCSRLGRFVKTGWLGHHKIFLAYDKQTGWSLAKLNFLQVFFRKLFRFYKHTHLNHVASKWHKCQITHHPLVEACQARIQAQWNKKYLIALGNANLSHAKVICFAGIGGADKAFRASQARFLDTHYQEGDVILTSSQEIGQTKSSLEHPSLQRLAKKDYPVQGWEPANFTALMGRPFILSQEYKRERENCKNQVEVLFQTPLTLEQLSRFDQELREIVGKIGELNVYYQSNSHFVINLEGFTIGFIDTMKINGIIPNRQEELRTTLLKALEKLEAKHNKAIYRNLTPVDQHTMLQANGPRIASLIQEIARWRNMNKRVFILGSTVNILNAPNRDFAAAQEELKRHSFLVLTNKTYLPIFNISLEVDADLSPQRLT